ncbi:aminoacyl-tRNA hydrolase [Glacieibacterium sp.]|uniref:aminoacyl-tRNA hydrolase n=1 Tax=Glacieibacterium sp. TaxID=2860237 RepID=UPI003AFF7E77
MQIFAGLGNPGATYALHRHNVGFMAVDLVHDMYRFDPWRVRFQGLTAEGRIGTEKLLLLKPATFMNDSGRSVGEALRFYKLGTEALTVFYDELDLAPGKVRVKTGGGAAGHNGIRSIDAHAGNDYRRVRLGIGHPGHKDRVLGHVLSNFAKVEQDWLADMLGAVAAEAPWLVSGDDARFMNEVARRTSERD